MKTLIAVLFFIIHSSLPATETSSVWKESGTTYPKNAAIDTTGSNLAFSDEHFIDNKTGKPIKELDFIWQELHQFYENDLPTLIKVKYHDDRFSGFEPPDKLWISNNHKKPRSRYHGVVKHESSHIGTYKMTEGASYTNRFRFLDEGLADVLMHEKKENNHREKCASTSKNFLTKGRISLELVMDWKIYFGDPYGTGTVDFNAYSVGSNFIYFITDTFGKKKVKRFFKRLNKKVNLNELFLKEFRLDILQIEEEWKKYILRI